MKQGLQQFRSNFFAHLLKHNSPRDVQFVIITHLLEDRPEFLSAISRQGPISLVLSIPYSAHETTQESLSKKYKILSPSLAELNSADYLLHHTITSLIPNKPVIIIEIGGYFSKIIHTLKQKLKNNLIGVIEDTETGHRLYEKIEKLPCPVISVARSTLKEIEDALIGSSCLFSAEKIFRQSGILMQGKQALILGFGKVGKGLATVLRRFCHVSVFDQNPIRLILAHNEGYTILEREQAIQQADIIFGASGNFSLKKKDFLLLKNGAILMSCSSKNIEFEMDFLDQHYQKNNIAKHITKIQNENHFFYLLAEGHPINFIDGAVIGHTLALIHAEIIHSITALHDLKDQNGLTELDEKSRQAIANLWLNCYFEKKAKTPFSHELA